MENKNSTISHFNCGDNAEYYDSEKGKWFRCRILNYTEALGVPLYKLIYESDGKYIIENITHSESHIRRLKPAFKKMFRVYIPCGAVTNKKSSAVYLGDNKFVVGDTLFGCILEFYPEKDMYLVETVSNQILMVPGNMVFSSQSEAIKNSSRIISSSDSYYSGSNVSENENEISLLIEKMDEAGCRRIQQKICGRIDEIRKCN